MKKLFGNTVRKLSVSSTSTSTSAFNLRRLSVHSNTSSTLNALQIKVLRGGYNIDLDKVDASFSKLHKAVYLNNEAKLVKYLAEISTSSGKKPPKHNVNALDSCHRSVLHLAAINGNLRIIKLLLAAGANVNIQDSDGRTPMIKAVECGHTDVLQVLLETGADVDLADKEKGNTALHTALIGANLDCALYIIRNALIIDYNKRNHKKETFLHLAAKITDLFVVIEELIANGIEIEATDELGRTAAQIAQLHGNESAYRVITKYAMAKAQPAIPMSSAAEDQLSASVDLNIGGPSSYENVSTMQQQQQQHQQPHPFQHPHPPPPPVSRTASRSSSKLSASDSFASSASSKSGAHNFLRFSGLFEETIIEENKKDSSSSSTTANDSLKSSPSKAKSMERSESIYENYQPPGSYMPPPSSTSVVRRKKPPAVSSSVSVEEEMLSGELSELDVLLTTDIGITSSSSSLHQQQRRSSTTVLGVSPTTTITSTATAEAHHSTSPTLASTVNQGQARVSRPKAQWLELLEEKEVTVLEHTAVRQAIEASAAATTAPSTASSNSSSVFTFSSAVPNGSSTAHNYNQKSESPPRTEHEQSMQQSVSASRHQSSPLGSPSSPTSPALAVKSTKQNSVISPPSSVKGRSTSNGSGLSIHAQPFQPRQIATLNSNGNGGQQQQQPTLSLSYAQVASFSPRKGATAELPSQPNKPASKSSPATSPPTSLSPSHANQQQMAENGFDTGDYHPASPAKLNNGTSLPLVNGAKSSSYSNRFDLTNRQSPARRSLASPRGSLTSSSSTGSSGSGYQSQPQQPQHPFLHQHNDFDRSKASRHSVSGGTSPYSATTNNHRATLNFAQQMMATGLPYHQQQQQQQQQSYQQPSLTTTFSYAQLVANQNGGCGGGGSLGRNMTPQGNHIFNGSSTAKAQLSIDQGIQTEESPEYSSSAKYDALLQSVDRLLASSSDATRKASSPTSSATPNWTSEMAILKRLSALVYTANHNSIELEYKRKEVALLKATTESLQAQLEHEQTLKRQFEGRLKRLLNPAGGRRASLMLLSGSELLTSASGSSSDSGNFVSTIQQYENALRMAVAENGALREEMEALREMYFQLQFEIGHSMGNSGNSAIANGEDVENSSENGNHHHLMTAAEFGYLLTQLDSKLTSLTETLADRQQQQQPKLLQQKTIKDEEDKPEMPPTSSLNNQPSNQSPERESFIVEQLRDEITGLKEMMLHLLMPPSNTNSALISNFEGHHHPLNQAALAELFLIQNSPPIAFQNNQQHHVRRHSDLPQRLPKLLNASGDGGDGGDSELNLVNVQLKGSSPVTTEHDRLSPRKSFSLHDLASLSENDGGGNGSPSCKVGLPGAQDLSKVDLAARKSYDSHLQQLEHYQQQQQQQNGITTTADAAQLFRKTGGGRSNLQADYSNSFSYKSKYFQSKINELRKQLGIAQ